MNELNVPNRLWNLSHVGIPGDPGWWNLAQVESVRLLQAEIRQFASPGDAYFYSIFIL